MSPETLIPIVEPDGFALRNLDDFYRAVSALHARGAELAELREQFEHWGDWATEQPYVDMSHVNAGGVPAIWVTPRRGASDRTLLCCHGGGYAAGSVYSHRKMYGHIAATVGCRALIVDYRLAPEHPHPAPAEDSFAAYKWLLQRGIRPQHIALIGDSAGAGLAMAICLKAREVGLPLPAGIVGLSPWIEMEAVDPIYDVNEADLIATREVVLASAETFLGADGDPRDHIAAPIYADLTDFPPIYMQAGGNENFAADARTVVDRAALAGTEATLDVFEGMQHVFQMLAGSAPEADLAIERISSWLKPRLDLAIALEPSGA